MKSYLGRFDIFSIVLGAIIGWGSFMLPGSKFLKGSGVINTLIGLTVGAIAIIIVEKNYKTMMEEHREEGGEFSYALLHLGKGHGFIVGWFLLLAYVTLIPLNATAVPLVFEKLFPGSLKFGYLYSIAGSEVYIGQVLVSILVIFIFTYINISGIKKSSYFQNIIIAALIGAVLLVFFGMLIKGDKTAFYENYITNYSFNIREIISVFAITPFAFIGFDAIPQLSLDFEFSAKKASFVAIVSLISGTLIYNLLNISTALCYSKEAVQTKEWALGSGVIEYLGKGGFIILVIALGAAVFGGINGFMICSSKLVASLAEKGVIFKKLSILNQKGNLKNAILFVSFISLVAPFFGREAINVIVNMSSLGASIAYLYVSFIVFKRNKALKIRIFGALGVSVSVLFLIFLLAPNSSAALRPVELIALGIWSLIGLIFYSFRSKNIK